MFIMVYPDLKGGNVKLNPILGNWEQIYIQTDKTFVILQNPVEYIYKILHGSNSKVHLQEP